MGGRLNSACAFNHVLLMIARRVQYIEEYHPEGGLSNQVSKRVTIPDSQLELSKGRNHRHFYSSPDKPFILRPSSQPTTLKLDDVLICLPGPQIVSTNE